MFINMSTSNKLYRQAHTDGGFTYHTDRETPTTGYMVSMEGYEEVTRLYHFRPAYIINYAEEYADELSNDGTYLGCWFYDGNAYLDISVHFDKKSDALNYAKQNKQLAIYDVANNKEINL